MQFLALGRWATDDAYLERLGACLEEELRYAWGAYVDENLRNIWYRADGEAPILLIEGNSADEVTTMLDATPFHRDGVATWDVIELKPFTSWSGLFRPDSNAEVNS
jgi:hypothetical protein